MATMALRRPTLVVLTLALTAVWFPASTKAEDPAPQAVEHKFGLEVSTSDESFTSTGFVDEHNLFVVADQEGNGLGFRPTLDPKTSAGGEQLVSLEVVTLKGIGDKHSETFLAGLLLKKGVSGCVDPGDGEGVFKVTVTSVTDKE